MSLTCGVDVGGTKISGAVVDTAGKVLEEHRVESPATDTEAIEDAIAGVVTELGSRHQIEAVGVGAAGYVSRSRAVIMFAPNLAWRDVNMKAELEERVHVPVVVENDANAAAWGEFRFGAAEDADEMLLVTVGTGVGGGIIVNGELFRGSFGSAAEIGHMRVVPGGRECGCGKLGCLEQYGSGSALVKNARAESGAPEAAALLDEAGGDPEQITGPMITELAQAGDPFCRAQLAEVGRWLGEGIASLAAVIDPAVVVIGGGVSEAGELLLDPIRTAFEDLLTAREYRPVLELRLATLGNRAGMIGAADLARR